jgi:hypothetical protein
VALALAIPIDAAGGVVPEESPEGGADPVSPLGGLPIATLLGAFNPGLNHALGGGTAGG